MKFQLKELLLLDADISCPPPWGRQQEGGFISMKYTLEAGGFNDSGDAGDWKEVSKSKPAVLSVIGNLTGTEKDDPKKEEFSVRAKMSGVFIPEDSEAGATTEDFLSATDDLSMLIMVPLTDYMSESLRKMGYGNIQLPYSQAPPMDNDNQDSV